MNMNNLILGSASAGTAAIGILYLTIPQTLLTVYGIDLQSASEANLFKAAYGGLFLSFALLFLLGLIHPKYAKTAQIALLTFMGGLAAGRLASLLTDGQPHLLLTTVFVVEAIYACAAAFLLKTETTNA